MALAFKKKSIFFLCALIYFLFSHQTIVYAGDPPPIPYPTTPIDNELVREGEYLTKAGDCIACHTDAEHHGKPFAGGLGLATPFGTFYSPNITADVATGIGSWSDADFIKAMREGVNPHHANYFPVFPYLYFNILNDKDLRAIKAYLFSIPKIHREKTPDDVSFPFSWRFLQYGWKLLFFYPYKDSYTYDPKQTAQWNRGAYLVQGLGHCGMCHTPHNIFGAEKRKYAFTGGFVNGFYAPDITAEGLKDFTIEEVMGVFKYNLKPKNTGKIHGPMLEANQDSLRYLKDEDLRAIVVYLKTVHSKHLEKNTAVVTGETGHAIYEEKCAVCHATGAAGAPKLGDSTAWKARLQQGIAKVIQHAIDGYNSMPAMGACPTCSTDEIKAAVLYMTDSKQLLAGNSKSTISTAPVASQLPLDLGKKVYDKTCHVCHASGLLGAPKLGDKQAWTPILKNDMDVLFDRALHGYKGMPPKGACYPCSKAEVFAAVKYMAQQSTAEGDYSLW